MLYHKDVFFPDNIVTPLCGIYKIRMTKHAIDSCYDDRYGAIKMGKYVQLSSKDFVEVELTNNTVTKFLVRFVYDSEYHISIVGIPNRHSMELLVKTVWLNHKSDNHSTLNRRLYVQY